MKSHFPKIHYVFFFETQTSQHLLFKQTILQGTFSFSNGSNLAFS